MNATERYTVLMDEADQRFHVKLEGEEEDAYIDYRWYDNRLMLLYIFVPVKFRGKGVSSALMQYALNYARSKDAKINIYCPYIAKYVRMHPEYHDLLEKTS